MAAAMEADAASRLDGPTISYLPTCSNSLSASASEDIAAIVGFGLGCFFLKSQLNKFALVSVATAIFPSVPFNLCHLPVDIASSHEAAAISGAAFGLFLTAAKTASAI